MTNRIGKVNKNTFMETLSSETDSLEPQIGLPIEANVVIIENGGQSIQSSVYPVNDTNEDRKNSVILKSDKDARNELPFKDINENKNHFLLDTTITNDSANNQMSDNVIIDIENETVTEEKDRTNGNNFNIQLIDEVENLNSLSPEEGVDISTEVKHTEKDFQSPKESETLNRFLNELYAKKLDLNNKISDQEIKDIRAAVEKQVNSLAKTIYEIDSRLKIQEVILVGSARERTQVIRSCEYDFILTLEALSKAGAVSIIPEDPEGDSREYMNVKLKDEDVRSMFHEFSNKDYIRASRLLPWSRQGLRDLFSTAVCQAVVLCSTSWVVMDTGKLKLTRSNPESNGPACTIRLLWERATTEKHTMEISVDLCSALKLNCEDYYSTLPSSDSVVSNDLDHVKSVLLMPREGIRFKVTFTEAELQLTSSLSEHHRKCYRLLKYIINGEPFPLETKSRIVKYFGNRHTLFHSYALKWVAWDHHYNQQCAQAALGLCVAKMLSKLQPNTAPAEDLIHPFNGNRIIVTSKWNDKFHKFLSGPFQLNVLEGFARLNSVLRGVQKAQNTPIEEYNYETICSAIEARCHWRWTKIFSVLIILCLFLGTALTIQAIIELDPTAAILTMVIMFFEAYIFFGRRVIYHKWSLLAKRLSLCTKHIDFWLICTCLITLWVLILLHRESAILMVRIIIFSLFPCIYLSFIVLFKRVLTFDIQRKML